MPKILKERSELDPQFQWDLTPMFESDAAWETALDSLDADIESLAAFAGKLTDAVTIGAYLDASTEVGRKVERLYCYASQRHDEDTRDDKAQSMYARIGSKYVKMAAALSFAQPEILSLPEETLTAIVNDPAVADYKFNLEDLLRGKPHTLTKAEEKLLASFGEVMSAPSEIYHNLEDADLLFDAVKDGSGETVEVTGSNFVPLEMSTDRTLRENAFHSYYKSYREHINTFAASYAGAIKAATAEAAARNYPSSRAMAMAGENVPAEVYDNLIATVRKHIPAMHRYVRLRKKMLGVDALHFYDVYAPLVGDLKKSYSYETAQEMVLKAVAPLGEDYQATVRKAYAERWIDVYPNRGKRGGAYSGGCYDSNPYILLNFSGTLDSVSTLAHEMGHTIHSWRSRQHQPPQYADYTLFVAEVASTVNENLLIEQLLANENDPQTRLYLLNQYLENFKGTVYRQTMFAEFEREAHAMVERGEALNAAALNALYKRLVTDYFGNDMVIDDEIQYEWARIPHFYRPFYVYKYATGYSTAVALSEGILKEGEPAVKRYKEFLSMGGSAYPLDELRHAGVDLATPAPVDAALEKGTMPKNPVAVKSIVSTPLADAVAKHYGVEMRNVLTGFKWIGDQIANLEAAGEVDRFIFGFEESYGYLAGPYVRDKDAVIGSMLICEMAAYYRSIGSSIKQRLEEIYAQYGRYLNKVDSFEFPGLTGMEKMASIMQKLRDQPPVELAGHKVVKVTDYKKPEETGLPAANVLIYTLENGATVVVRPSGTEPKIKTYFTTLGKDLAEAQAQKDALAAAIEPILK